VTPKGLQEEVNCSGQTAETVFAAETPKQAEEANRLISFRRCMGYSFGNCLKDSLEPLRFNAAEDLTPEEEVPDRPNGFGCSGVVDYLLQNFVTSR
jgi:hypothetical protein